MIEVTEDLDAWVALVRAMIGCAVKSLYVRGEQQDSDALAFLTDDEGPQAELRDQLCSMVGLSGDGVQMVVRKCLTAGDRRMLRRMAAKLCGQP
jgi:hypothetical protein